MNMAETGTCLSWMCIGVLMWSYIMSTLTAMLTELSESEQRMRKHLDILREFCRN